MGQYDRLDLKNKRKKPKETEEDNRKGDETDLSRDLLPSQTPPTHGNEKNMPKNVLEVSTDGVNPNDSNTENHHAGRRQTNVPENPSSTTTNIAASAANEKGPGKGVASPNALVYRANATDDAIPSISKVLKKSNSKAAGVTIGPGTHQEQQMVQTSSMATGPSRLVPPTYQAVFMANNTNNQLVRIPSLSSNDMTSRQAINVALGGHAQTNIASRSNGVAVTNSGENQKVSIATPQQPNSNGGKVGQFGNETVGRRDEKVATMMQQRDSPIGEASVVHSIHCGCNFDSGVRSKIQNLDAKFMARCTEYGLGNRNTHQSRSQIQRDPKSPLCIAYVLPHYNLSGEMRVIVQHLKMLVSRNHKVHAIHYTNKRASTTASAIPSWAKIDGLAGDHVLGKIESVDQLESQFNFDVIVVCLFTQLLMLINSKTGKQRSNVVYFEQGNELLFGNRSEKARKNQGSSIAYHQAMSSICTFVFTVSDPVKQLILRGFNRDVAVVHNGIDTELFTEGVMQSNLRTHLAQVEKLVPRNAADKLYSVLVVGNPNIKSDNVDLAFDVIEQLQLRDGVRIRPVLICNLRPMSSELDNKLRELNTYVVENNLSQEALPALYRGHDLLIYASEREEIGLPVLEAMASGVPVLTTNGIGSVHFCTHEVNSLVCSTADREQLVSAAYRLLLDEPLRSRLVQSAREMALGLSLGSSGDALNSVLHAATSIAKENTLVQSPAVTSLPTQSRKRNRSQEPGMTGQGSHSRQGIVNLLQASETVDANRQSIGEERGVRQVPSTANPRQLETDQGQKPQNHFVQNVPSLPMAQQQYLVRTDSGQQVIVQSLPQQTQAPYPMQQYGNALGIAREELLSKVERSQNDKSSVPRQEQQNVVQNVSQPQTVSGQMAHPKPPATQKQLSVTSDCQMPPHQHTQMVLAKNPQLQVDSFRSQQQQASSSTAPPQGKNSNHQLTTEGNRSASLNQDLRNQKTSQNMERLQDKSSSKIKHPPRSNNSSSQGKSPSQGRISVMTAKSENPASQSNSEVKHALKKQQFVSPPGQIVSLSQGQQQYFGPPQGHVQLMVHNEKKPFLADLANNDGQHQFVQSHVKSQTGQIQSKQQFVIPQGQQQFVVSDGQQQFVIPQGQQQFVASDGQQQFVIPQGQQQFVVYDGQQQFVIPQGQQQFVVSDGQQQFVIPQGQQQFVVSDGQQQFVIPQGQQQFVVSDGQQQFANPQGQQQFVVSNGQQQVFVPQDHQYIVIPQGQQQFVLASDQQYGQSGAMSVSSQQQLNTNQGQQQLNTNQGQQQYNTNQGQQQYNTNQAQQQLNTNQGQQQYNTNQGQQQYNANQAQQQLNTNQGRQQYNTNQAQQQYNTNQAQQQLNTNQAQQQLNTNQGQQQYNTNQAQQQYNTNQAQQQYNTNQGQQQLNTNQGQQQFNANQYYQQSQEQCNASQSGQQQSSTAQGQQQYTSSQGHTQFVPYHSGQSQGQQQFIPNQIQQQFSGPQGTQPSVSNPGLQQYVIGPGGQLQLVVPQVQEQLIPNSYAQPIMVQAANSQGFASGTSFVQNHNHLQQQPKVMVPTFQNVRLVHQANGDSSDSSPDKADAANLPSYVGPNISG